VNVLKNLLRAIKGKMHRMTGGGQLRCIFLRKGDELILSRKSEVKLFEIEYYADAQKSRLFQGVRYKFHLLQFHLP
jgi:hypothetical protein